MPPNKQQDKHTRVNGYGPDVRAIRADIANNNIHYNANINVNAIVNINLNLNLNINVNANVI
eukprot:5877195-Lingulodinium_polyedra.AAC.1